ncbi:MAG TPA: diguanylate cyclase [Steroidobacteraceae bacterium]|jgi:diguanylate cyclase (GGDEF)-like protein
MQPDRKLHVLEDTGLDLHDTILTERMEADRPCRVLVVDDDELVRARLAALLRTGSFEVECAGSGEEALKVMASRHCQVLLTDWQMPDMDGLTLCRIVRAEHSESYVYVLMLTVRDSKQDVLTGLAAGADDYVSKSAPVEEIMARLEVARRITHVEYSLRTSNRENRRLAVTDALTGAHNLRYLMRNLPRELARAQRYGHPLAVLSCDIDRFKQINDGFGHEIGNEVLRAFVARADSCIRKGSDWLARVGGDEFLVVLPETNAIGANRVAQKLHQVFARFPVATQAGPVTFTASIGVTAVEAEYDGKDGSKIEDLLRAADRGLYASKKLGGNQATSTSIQIPKKPLRRPGGKNGIN